MAMFNTRSCMWPFLIQDLVLKISHMDRLVQFGRHIQFVRWHRYRFLCHRLQALQLVPLMMGVFTMITISTSGYPVSIDNIKTARFLKSILQQPPQAHDHAELLLSTQHHVRGQ